MSTPAGWYDDHHGALRWWDGSQWTDRVQSPAGPADPASVPPPADPASAPGAADPASVPPGRAGGPSSRIWIVWVSLGGLLVLLVIAAAILVPVVIGLVTTAESAGVGDDDRDAAVGAVELYDDAWSEADCEAYQGATTGALREGAGLADCASFETAAADFDAATDDYRIEVTGVQVYDDGSIDVTTTETYLSTVGADGEILDVPEPAEDVFVYTVVHTADGWRIDGVQ